MIRAVFVEVPKISSQDSVEAVKLAFRCLMSCYLQGSLVRFFHVTMSSDLLTRQVLGNHFLMETRIVCFIKQDQYEFMTQKHQVGFIDHCIGELQHQACAQ